MKLANRIFLVLGAMSMFSLFQFEAMGGNEKKDCTSVNEGRYCWHKGDKHDCPAGCWCEGKKISVEKFFENKSSFEKACALRTLNENGVSGTGVHLCPEGKTSVSGAKEVNDCVDGLTAWDGKRNCDVEASAGTYCHYRGLVKEACKPGCYCTGGKNAIGSRDEDWGRVTSACENHWLFTKDYLEARNVMYCPDAFPKSDNGAKSIDECYFEENYALRYYKDYGSGIMVSAGYYLPKSKTTKQSCETLGDAAVCLGGSLVPSATSDVGITQCTGGKIPNQNRSQCVCPGETEWDNAQDACVSRYTVTYNCNGGTGTVPTDSNEYLEGYSVTVKSNTCIAPSGKTFDRWSCDNNVGHKTPNQIFAMPSANVTCTAQWTVDRNCSAGQYWSFGLVDGVQMNLTATSLNNIPPSLSTDRAATRSVVSRVASTSPAFAQASAMSGTATGSLSVGNTNTWSSARGSCRTCEVGYYCPGGDSVRMECPAGKTSDAGASSANDCYNITDPDADTYTVTYRCGDGTGTPPVDSRRYEDGDDVTLKSKGNCTASMSFNGWNCGNNVSATQPGETFTMPSANVTCTAQWGNNPQVCGVGQYQSQDGCKTCPVGHYCPDGVHKNECSGNKYIDNTGSTAESDCLSCPDEQVAVGNHSGCSDNHVHCDAGQYLGDNNQCVDCESDYVCPGGNFDPDEPNNNGLESPSSYCEANQIVNSDQTGCVTCSGETTPNSTYSECVNNSDTPVSCTTAGKYWDGDGCITCESGYFCPGNGQHYKCPFSGASTQNKASCVLNLNETQMEYNKCWLRYWNNAAAYRKCLYGIDLATLPH